jgi:hypothetical protein
MSGESVEIKQCAYLALCKPVARQGKKFSKHTITISWKGKDKHNEAL